jgi:outer membrane lipoprotein-sorting protein
MQGQRRKSLSVYLLLSILSACAILPKKDEPIKEKIRAASSSRTEMSGNVKFTQETEKGSITLPGTFVLRWPDQARLEVQDPFGGVQFLLILNKENFWMYRSDWKENLQGRVSDLGKFSSIPIRGENFLPIFLARPNLTDFAQKGEVLLGAETQEIRWDHRYQLASWSFSLGDRGKGSAKYLDWASQSGALYPTKLQLILEKEGKSRSIFLQWDDWSSEAPQRSSIFQIPPSADFGKSTKALR